MRLWKPLRASTAPAPSTSTSTSTPSPAGSPVGRRGVVGRVARAARAAAEALERRVLMYASPAPDYAAGFPASVAAAGGDAGLTLLGGAALDGAGGLRLNPGDGSGPTGNAYFAQRVDVAVGFETHFRFRLGGHGLTFVVQAHAPDAAGGVAWGGIGYAGVPDSLAVKLDNSGELGSLANTTGLYVGGQLPTLPDRPLGDGTGVNVTNGHAFDADLTYDGVGQQVTLVVTDATDAAHPTVTQQWAVDLPAAIGGATTAWVGFGGGDGWGGSAVVSSWAYAPAAAAPAARVEVPASVDEGWPCVADLSGTLPAGAFDHWLVDWGDGTDPDLVPADLTSAAHRYADAPAGGVARTVTATPYAANPAHDPESPDPGEPFLPAADPATATVQVLNVAPSLLVSRPATAVAGQAYAMTLSAADPGDDALTGWDVNWGDGTSDHVAAPATAAVAHVYAATGTPTLAVTATDEDGTWAATTAGLDSGFDAGGTTAGLVTTDFSTAPNLWGGVTMGDADWATAVAVQPDGKVVVAGTAQAVGYASIDPGEGFLVVARYNPDGTLDATFGDGTGPAPGTVVSRTGYGTYQWAESRGLTVAVADDGKILVGGTDGTSAVFMVERRNPDGTLDASYGAGGLAVVGVAGGDAATKLVPLPDGRLVVLGTSQNVFFSGFRLTAAGQVDPTFGGGGDGRFAVWLSTGTRATDGLRLADGRLAQVGTVDGQMAAIVYTADGLLDGSFGAGGVARFGFGDAASAAAGIAQQPDGKLVVSGTTGTGGDTRFAVARLTLGGALDTTFGAASGTPGVRTGLATARFSTAVPIPAAGGDDHAGAATGADVAVLPDGKLLVVGTARVPTRGGTTGGPRMALARFAADGTPDASFGVGGRLTVGVGTAGGGLNALAVGPDGRLFVAGASGTSLAVMAGDVAAGAFHPTETVTVLPGPAESPVDLVVQGTTATTALLTWTAPAAAPPGGYAVFRGNVRLPGPAAPTTTTTAATAYRDAGLTPGTSYSYVVWSLDADGVPLKSSNAAVATTLATPFDMTPPPAPTALQTTGTVSDHSLTLRWAYGGAGYEPATFGVYQDGVFVGQVASSANPTSAATYTLPLDGLEAGVPHAFAVTAQDDTGNVSPAATLSAGAAADGTDPLPVAAAWVAGRSGTTVSLAWVPASDNVGVASYEVHRSRVDAAGAVVPGGADAVVGAAAPDQAPAYADATADPAGRYVYWVAAVDAAGHRSAAGAAATAEPTEDLPRLDSAPDQYVPQPFVDDFYDNITAVLRDRWATAGLAGAPPTAARWLDAHYSTATPGDGIVVQGVALAGLGAPSGVPALRLTYNTVFHDRNGNGRVDPDEAVWRPSSGSTLFHTGDAVVRGTAPWPGTAGIALPYADLNGDGQRNPAEPVFLDDLDRVRGTERVAYYDADNNGVRGPAEPAWADDDGDRTLGAGEDVLVGDRASVPAGARGRDGGQELAWVAADGGQPVRFAWADQGTFRQDFARVYRGVEAVIPKFATPAVGGAASAERLTFAGALTTAGAVQAVGTGTFAVTVTEGVDEDGDPYRDVEMSGTGTHFTREVQAGDLVVLNGVPCAIGSVVSDTALTLAEPYAGASADGPFTFQTWTKVFARAAADGLPQLYRMAGRPDADDALFAGHFAELHAVLGQLNQLPNLYDVARYDDTSGPATAAAAARLLGLYRSLYGSGGPPSAVGDAAELERALRSGELAAGAVRRASHVGIMRELAGAVGSVDYAWTLSPDPGVAAADGPAAAGWVRDPAAAARQVTAPSLGPANVLADDLAPAPLTFGSAYVRGALLPARTVGGAAVAAGDWSEASPGGAILPDHLAEVGSFVGAMAANGLWVGKGKPAGQTVAVTDRVDEGGFYSTIGSTSPESYETVPPAWPGLPDFDDWTVDGLSGARIGYASTTSGGDVLYVHAGLAEYGAASNTVHSDGVREHAAVSVTYQLPAGGNPYGGAALAGMATDALGDLLDTSGWAWGGSTQELAGVSGSDVHDLLAAHFHALPTTPVGGTPSLSVGTAAGGSLPGLAWDATTTQYTDQSAIQGGSQRVYAWVVIPRPDLYGNVPVTAAAGGPTWTATDPVLLAAVPAGEIPLTTEMDLFNVVGDVDADDVVRVDHDQTTFGPDSGSQYVQLLRDGVQTVLPLDENLTGNLPVHAYLAEGGFGSGAAGSVGALRSRDVVAPAQDEDGTPWAYSLNTRARVNLLLSDPAGNRVKRVEVVRPRGNAVVFDFAWDAATNRFSPVGTPGGTGGRDADRLYVLRDVTPQDDADLSYELRFPDGITHVFRATDGKLTAVRDDLSGLSAGVSGANPLTGPTSGGWLTASQRYDVRVDWSDGALAAVDYRTKGGSPSFVRTSVTYAAGAADVAALSKLANENAAVPLSYAVTAAGTVYHMGTTVARSGSAAAGGTVTFTVTADDAPGGSVESAVTLDGHRLPTQQVDTLVATGTPTTTATTTWAYEPDAGRYAGNGAPTWAKVEHVVNPDGSWAQYAYDEANGWLKSVTTPYQDGQLGAAGQAVEAYAYALPADGSGTDMVGAYGDVADPTRLAERPRLTTATVAGQQVGQTLARYVATTVTTKTAAGAGAGGPPKWNGPGALTGVSTATRFDSSSVKTPTGSAAVTTTPASGSAPRTVVATGSFFNRAASTATTKVDPFGTATESSGSALGATPTSAEAKDAGDVDAFGRVLRAAAAGQPAVRYDYGSGVDTSWLGPVAVTQFDVPDAAGASATAGATTAYTYYPTGRVHTATATLHPRDGETIVTVTTYAYDAAGDVVSVSTDGTATGQSPVHTETSAAYDVRGRLRSATDAVGQTTAVDYAESAATGTTVTTTYADTTTRVEAYRLDGSPEGVSGTAVYPSEASHGVVGGSGDEPYAADALHPAGSTWAQSSTTGGANVTTTFYDTLGRPFRVERTAPASTPDGTAPAYTQSDAPLAVATTAYDPNGRVSRTVDFDGTVTLYLYDAKDGTADVVLDLNRDDHYKPLVDRKTTTRYTAANPTAGVQGTVTRSLADAGVSTSTATAENHGLKGTSVVDGRTATTEVTYDGSGQTVVATTAPDGTRTVETSKQGLLLSTANYGTTGTIPVTSEEYHYDGLGRLASVYDPAWGTTTYERRADGQVTKVTYPDERTTVYGDFDAKTNAPTGTTRPDAKTQGSTLNALGQTTTAQGAGVITQRLGYDARTGQMTGLTTFRSGTLDDSSTAATTGWAYDDATGLLKSKTWADGSSDQFKYNAGLQLRETDRPGQSTAYAYNNAGELTQTATTDATHGNLTTLVLTRDDAGRPVLTTQVAQGVGQVFGGSLQTAVSGYTALDQLKLDKSGDTGAGTVYEYYGQTENTGGAAPGALKSTTVKKGSTVLQQTTYTYDVVTKRLATVTVLVKGQNGAADRTLTYGYTYKANTDFVATVTVTGVGTTAYAYEDHTGRVQDVTVANPTHGTLYETAYTAYTQVDQRRAEQTTYKTAAGATVEYTANYGYDADDPANAHPIDALASVTRTYTAESDLPDESYAYAYDGVGNRTSATANGATVTTEYNGSNQVDADGYDARGNQADGLDGDAFEWDAADRLAAVTLTGDLTRLEFAYDPSGRRVEKRVYARAATTAPWALDAAATRRYAYDGSVVTAEFDGLNHLRTTYARGPTGLLAVTDQTAAGGPAVYVPVLDGTGSVVALLASDGSVAATFRYDPYGQLLSADGPAANVGGYRFAGGWLDGETGLQYHLNRYYNPRDGRFLSRDPTAEQGGLNVYAYAGGDPVNRADPFGLSPESSALKERAMLGQNPRCQACHGTGILDGTQIVANLDPYTQAAIMAWTNTNSPTAAQYRIEDTKRNSEAVQSRIGGAGRVVAGTLVAVGSLGADSTVIGAPAGAASGLWGADQIGTGLTEIWTGRYQTSVGGRMIQAKGGTGPVGQGLTIAYDLVPAVAVGGAGAADRFGEANAGVMALQEEAAEARISIALRQEVVASRSAAHVALRSKRAELLREIYAAGKGSWSKSEITKLRGMAVSEAWAEEELMVRLTGEGSRRWTGVQKAELAEEGRVFDPEVGQAFHGHHMNSVLGVKGWDGWRPVRFTGSPRNIEFVSASEDQLRHFDPITGAVNTQVPIPPPGQPPLPLINRTGSTIQAKGGQ